jgi:hypothetical protein
VGFQFGLQAFPLLLADIVEAGLELELLDCDFEFFPRLIDEFSSRGGVLLLLLQTLRIMRIVILVVFMLVVQLDVEDVDSPIS